MNTAQVLARLRRLIEQTDASLATSLSDEELLEHILDAVNELTIRGVDAINVTGVTPPVSAFTVGTDQTVTTPPYGISPAPTVRQGELMAFTAALNILDQEFRGKVLRGEIGSSWTSGLEQQSTITAAQLYKTALDDLRDQLEQRIMLAMATFAGRRTQ